MSCALFEITFKKHTKCQLSLMFAKDSTYCSTEQIVQSKQAISGLFLTWHYGSEDA